MKTLDLTVVADRLCPTSRTYLLYLARAGYRVRKIILCDFMYGSGGYKKLRSILGPIVAGKAMCLKRGPWPRYSPVMRDLFKSVQASCEFFIDYSVPFDFRSHAESIDHLVVEDYDDPRLHAAMLRQDIKTFLYTNGGRVPGTLLAQPDVRILHIHPGVVPHVRGSDGLLWSIATRHRPGVSCFYMDVGIDTGRLIGVKEFACPVLDIPVPENRAAADRIYNALLIAYDPHLRASLLRDIIAANDGKKLDMLENHPQPEGQNDSFLWMHGEIRRKIISDTLCKTRS